MTVGIKAFTSNPGLGQGFNVPGLKTSNSSYQKVSVFIVFINPLYPIGYVEYFGS
jgi:hypothetical protein